MTTECRVKKKVCQVVKKDWNKRSGHDIFYFFVIKENLHHNQLSILEGSTKRE